MKVEDMIGRLHKARTLALFRSQTHLVVRVQTNLGFCAKYATWDLIANTVKLKARGKIVSVEDLAARLSVLKPFATGLLFGEPLVERKIEFRDGDGT